MFVNIHVHVDERVTRGFCTRACDVLPPRLAKTYGAARNINKHAHDDGTALQNDVDDDTPVVMSVWRVGETYPTVRKHDGHVCEREHDFVLVQLHPEFDPKLRTSELGWTHPVCGMGDAAPDTAGRGIATQLRRNCDAIASCWRNCGLRNCASFRTRASGLERLPGVVLSIGPGPGGIPRV